MLLADFTSLFSVRLTVTDDGDGRIVVLIPDSDPSDTVGCSSANVQKLRVAVSLTVVPVVSVCTVADCQHFLVPS
jgi:hypothetical protein